MGKTEKYPMRVLVTRFSAIGDVAMTIPVVYGVCRANPSVMFIFLSRPSLVRMMINRPANLVAHGIDVNRQYKGVRGLHRLYKELADRFDFDMMVDLHAVLRTRLLGMFAWLDNVRVARIDKGRTHRRALTRRRNKVLLPLPGMTERYARAFEDAGLNPPQPFMSLWDAQGAPAEEYAAITDAKPEGEQWIAVAPFARHRGKIYPPDKMRSVVELIVESHPQARVFLLGGGEEECATLRSWADALPRVTSIADKRFGFPTELALMSHLDVMVSMDSANMHLASIVNVPVVAVWGATHPYCGFRGWGQSDATAVQLNLDCRPCSVFGNKPCHRGDYLCLEGITPRMIADKVSQLLEKTRRVQRITKTT